LGRTTEPSDSAYWGLLNVVASGEGVMNAANAPCSNAVSVGSMRRFAWVCIVVRYGMSEAGMCSVNCAFSGC
jgi:hypothetical protein